MTEKRFTRVEFSNGIWGVKDNNTEYEYPSPIDLLDLLNEQEQKIQLLEKVNEDLREVNKENQLLHEENVKQCERWKRLYEIKDAEVTARVKRLNEICNRYKYAITFDKDIDPNDAVNILCDRILQTEVEM